ncbi:MAG: hypothetical protein AAGC55_33610, partial [Myxococcota bacterium]
QRYLWRDTAVHLSLSGTRLDQSHSGPGGDTTGFTVSAGAKRLLPALLRPLRWAAVVDAQVGAGPDLSESLAPPILTDNRSGAFGAGVVANLGQDIAALTGHARYIHTALGEADDIGALDLGLTLSSALRWTKWLCGPQLPLGLRVHYRYSHELTSGVFRAHELAGGLYLLHRRRYRVGVDVTASYARISPELDARTVSGLVRLDLYWDSNR